MRSGLVLFISMMFAVGSLNAQNKQILYDFIEVPQALMLNPGMQTSYQWHAGIPLLSGIAVQGATSGISVNDIFANDGLDINDKVRDRAINGLSKRDDVNGTYQIEVFSGGFRLKNHPESYISFGMYHEGFTINYWPRDLAILAFEGNADMIGRRFDLSHLKVQGEVLNVFHLGWNKKMNRNLTLGARGKLYSSIMEFNSSSNDGAFVTNPGQNNLLASTLVSDMQLRSSGIEAIRQAIDDDGGAAEVAKIFTKRGLFGGDLGLGIDLGVSYNLNPQTLITGSLLDLGFVYHYSDVQNYTLEGRATIEGIEVILPDALLDPDADFWQDLVDEIEEFIPFEENNNNYVTFRPVKLYGSIRHNFGEPPLTKEACDCDYKNQDINRNFFYRNSVGGQIYVINRPRGPQAALTGFYQRRIGNILALKGTYTIDKYTLTNFGLGMSLQAGPVNFYIVADNLLGYRNIAASHYASFQFGLNILSWNNN